MKYSNGLVISAAALAILTTGCVKRPTNETGVVYDNSQPQTVYDNSQPQTVYDNSQSQTVYDTGAPIVYDNTAVTTNGSIYSGEGADNTVITTTDAYGQPVESSGNTAYGEPATSNTGAYNNPNSETTYSDPYGGTTQPSYNSNSTYNTSSNTSSATGGGIHLQVAALKDYYAAEEFKNSLSLEPGLSAYVKRGNPNKVIISGISSQSEVQRLKSSRFPGAFVVSGGATTSSNYNSYTINNSYGSTSSASSNGLGVQIGAFSSRSKAQDAADSASSKYAALVKTVKRNGKTLYKAILTGFASERAARSFIANRGDGFIVHGL